MGATLPAPTGAKLGIYGSIEQRNDPSTQALTVSVNSLVVWNTPTSYLNQMTGTASRLTCQVAGRYLVGGVATYNAVNAAYRLTRIAKNGVVSNFGTNAELQGNANWRVPASSVFLDLLVGDYVELNAYTEQAGSNILLEHCQLWAIGVAV